MRGGREKVGYKVDDLPDAGEGSEGEEDFGGGREGDREADDAEPGETKDEDELGRTDVADPTGLSHGRGGTKERSRVSSRLSELLTPVWVDLVGERALTVNKNEASVSP